MPGPISESYDPCPEDYKGREEDIRDELDTMYALVSDILGHKEPMFILDLLKSNNGRLIARPISEKGWRLIRFALGKVIEDI